jgi:hypothetical protein
VVLEVREVLLSADADLDALVVDHRPGAPCPSRRILVPLVSQPRQPPTDVRTMRCMLCVARGMSQPVGCIAHMHRCQQRPWERMQCHCASSHHPTNSEAEAWKARCRCGGGEPSLGADAAGANQVCLGADAAGVSPNSRDEQIRTRGMQCTSSEVSCRGKITHQ